MSFLVLSQAPDSYKFVWAQITTSLTVLSEIITPKRLHNSCRNIASMLEHTQLIPDNTVP
jgi:hypothetical protein